MAVFGSGRLKIIKNFLTVTGPVYWEQVSIPHLKGVPCRVNKTFAASAGKGLAQQRSCPRSVTRKMSTSEKEIKKAERTAKLAIWMAGRSSRNKSLIDKICRFLVTRATAVKPEYDFLRDPLIDNNMGFDPDELDRLQRGETD